MRLSAAATLFALLAAACGSPYSPPKKYEPGDDVPGGPEAYSPGMFADTAAVLEEQAGLADADAAEVILAYLTQRAMYLGEVPAMPGTDRDTLDALVLFGFRAVYATAQTPVVARQIGEEVLALTLGLDPRLDARNAAGEHLEVTQPGPVTIATLARRAVGLAALDAPMSCSSAAFASSGASFEPGTPNATWVDGACEPDVFIEGTCEPDVWVEGGCHDEWLPEECTSNRWEDEGRYEWTCYSADDCRYVWREYWVFHEGECQPGRYEEVCEADHWQDGVCYDGYTQEGECAPGHYEYDYPDSHWSFAALTVPLPCQQARPAQQAIAAAGVEALFNHLLDDLGFERQAALIALLNQGGMQVPNEATLAAALQILDGVIADGL